MTEDEVESDFESEDIPMTALDPPALIGIIGAGPVGIEAALYARFLGYDVIVWEQGEIAGNISEHAGDPTAFSQLVTPLALNALAAQTAQSDDDAARSADEMTTAEEWRDEYLLPVAKTDLIRKQFHTQTAIESVSSVEPPTEGEGDSDPPPTAFTVKSADEQTWENVVAIIDTAGPTPFISDLTFDWTAIATAEPIKLAEALVTSITNYYVLGAKSWGERRGEFTVGKGHDQIRALFSLIGDRENLDLYRK